MYFVAFQLSIPFLNTVSCPVCFSLPTEPRRLSVSGSHDAERSGEGEARTEAGGPRGWDGLHPHGAEQTLGRPTARRLETVSCALSLMWLRVTDANAE